MDELTKDILKCIAARYPFSYQDISRLYYKLKSIDILIECLDKSLALGMDPFHFDYLKWQAQQSPIDYEGYRPLPTGGLRGEPPQKP